MANAMRHSPSKHKTEPSPKLFPLVAALLVAVFVLALFSVACWLAVVAHESGHAAGCLVTGRTITRWFALNAVDCGMSFSAGEAWAIGLPAYLIPLTIGCLLIQRVARGIRAPALRLAGACTGLVIFGYAVLSLGSSGWFAFTYSVGVRIPGNGDVLNFLGATGANHRTVGAVLFGGSTITVLASITTLWQTLEALLLGWRCARRL